MSVPVGSRWTNTKQLNKEELQEFGDFLYKSRMTIEYSVAEMADLLDTHRTSYRRWERGMCVPHGEVKKMIEDVKAVVDYVEYQKAKVAI